MTRQVQVCPTCGEELEDDVVVAYEFLYVGGSKVWLRPLHEAFERQLSYNPEGEDHSIAIDSVLGWMGIANLESLTEAARHRVKEMEEGY